MLTIASRIRLITFLITVGLSSLGLASWDEHVLGGVVLPSHESTWEMGANVGPNLPFLKRLWNFVSLWRYLHFLYTEYVPINQQLAEKYLGPLPPLIDIMKNKTSMVFINQAIAITPARPRFANAISFTSSHIQKKLPPLPKVRTKSSNCQFTLSQYFSTTSPIVLVSDSAVS